MSRRGAQTRTERPAPRSTAPRPTRPGRRGRGPAARRAGVRLQVALVAIGVLLLAVCTRLVQLQGLDASGYARAAALQRMHTLVLPADRGAILDRYGRPLAMTVDARAVVVDPTLVTSATTEATALSPLLGRSVAVLAGLMRVPHTRYVVLEHGVAPELADRVDALGLPGVATVAEPKRIYPDGTLAASVIGFAPDGPGTGAGLELADNALLSGHDGQLVAQFGANGSLIPDATQRQVAAEPGSSLELTIDPNIQFEAQQAIEAQVRATRSDSGVAIVMDPRNGQLLAMATAPGFDPANPGAAPTASLANTAVSDVYEPGSVNKVITFSGALQEGVITPATPITVPPQLLAGGTVFHDAEVHGTEHLTATGVLAQSSNIGTIKIEERLGAARLYKYLRAFGFGRPTGLDFPGESPGILPPPSQWSATTQYTAAFGQGVSVTALQVADVYAAVANGGTMITPTLVRGVIPPGGRFTPARAPAAHRVISARVAAELRDMLETVTTNLGTAPLAHIPGYRVAGKTGTAQRADPRCGCYRGYTASFVGFAPADNPQLLVEVVLQNPKRGEYGGSIAAPVFHQVMSFALESEHVAPTGTRPPKLRLTAP